MLVRGEGSEGGVERILRGEEGGVWRNFRRGGGAVWRDLRGEEEGSADYGVLVQLGQKRWRYFQIKGVAEGGVWRDLRGREVLTTG